MSTLFSVKHKTTYRYSSEVNASQSLVHLMPRATMWQKVQSSIVSCEPQATDRTDYTDVFGNNVTYLAIEQPHSLWSVVGESYVHVESPSDTTSDISWSDAASRTSSGAEGPSVTEMTLPSEHAPVGDELADFARASFLAGGRLVDGVRSLIYRIYSDFQFDPTATEVSTPVASVMVDRRGVCQDFAHLSIACLRSIGLAARYVSGYLETDPAPGIDKLVGSDASHAWFSVYIPGFGWLDADPTNGVLPFGRHITVGWGRDYTDVAPSRGVVFGPPSTQQLDVAVDVTRVDSVM
jgi:transglutaminase-like putative cysteine protease